MDILETITAERKAAEEFEADRKRRGEAICPSCGRVGLIWKVKRNPAVLFRSEEFPVTVEDNVQYLTCQQCWWQDLNITRPVA